MPAALVGERALFIHFPKTGGTWVTRAMQRAGLELRPLPVNHPNLAELQDELDGHEPRFRFAFVRHPLTWWQSYWRYRMQQGWDPGHDVDSVARSDAFPEFVAAVVEHVPGYLSQRYREFVGPPGREIEFIGRAETLVDGLVTALRLAGEPFDEVRLRAVKPKNVTDRTAHTAKYSRATAELLVQAESEAVTRFYAAPYESELSDPKNLSLRS